MSTLSRAVNGLKNLLRKSTIKQASWVSPAGQQPTMFGVTNHAEAVRLAHHFYIHNSLLRTVISVLERETFRNGIIIKKGDLPLDPKDLQANYPDLHLLLTRANDVMTLEEVLRTAYIELNITGNAFLIFDFNYDYNADGVIIRKTLNSVYKANTEFVELIMSMDGRAGMNMNGDLIMFCPEHRQVPRIVPIKDLEEHEVKERIVVERCTRCGKVLLPAFMRFNSPVSGDLYFSYDEVVHLKKWVREFGMGTPPILTILQKLYTMEAHDYFISTFYTLQRPPNTVIFLKAGNFRNLEGTLQQAFMEAQANPRVVPIISVDFDAGEKFFDVLSLNPKPEEAEYIKFRDEVRSEICALYSVTPIFTGDLRGVGGLNQEGLQIMITNRTVEDEQRIINQALDRILKAVVADPELKLVLEKNEFRDEVSLQEYNSKVLQNIQTLSSLGIKVKIGMSEGKISYSIDEEVITPTQTGKGLFGRSPLGLPEEIGAEAGGIEAGTEGGAGTMEGEVREEGLGKELEGSPT